MKIKMVLILLILPFLISNAESARRVKRKKQNAEEDDNPIDTLGTVGDKTFCSGKKMMKWGDALDFCHSFQMGLATIRTDEEQNCVVGGMEEKGHDCLWISATDLFNERNWRWMEGWKKISFNKWAKGEATKENLDNNCAYIEASGKWFPTSCSRDMNIPLCERIDMEE